MTLQSIARYSNAFRPLQRRKSRRGLTLLELLLAIAAGVAITITAVILYMKTTGGNKTNEAFTQVQSIVSDVRNLYGAQSGFGTSDITQTAVLGKVFESNYLEGDQPINPWSGDITLTGAGRTFTLDYPKVPQQSCAQLIAMNSSGFGGAVVSVKVNGADVGTQAVDPAQATAACNDANDNTITWEFAK